MTFYPLSKIVDRSIKTEIEKRKNGSGERNFSEIMTMRKI